MSSKLPPFILQEQIDISECIQSPLKRVNRIKYTCFDVSKTLIAFGATSGGIYVFNRNPCEFIQLIPNKDGTITRLAISSDEKHISFANGRGMVTVTSCDQSLCGSNSVISSKEHQGNEVTAMCWSQNNLLFTGDDIGKIAVLQLMNFIAKTMFHNASQILMSLDSRICQLDVKGSMLLVSTLTRCYICDTSQEQYRQIGQKLRDGEFGACFCNTDKPVNNTAQTNEDKTEIKKFNKIDNDTKFAVSNELVNTMIYCSRPSSRLWEATIDGTVKRTHQYKQVLAKKPMAILSIESYLNENINLEIPVNEGEGQSINFQKIYRINDAIFSFTKDALYFLNLNDVDDTMWFSFKDIADCRVYHDTIYIWKTNGSLIHLRYTKLEKFLIKSFIDEKFILCAELCAFYREFLLANNLSNKLHILVGLRDKLQNKEVLNNIDDVLKKFESLKSNEATQMKSGIYVVDNTYNTSCYLQEDEQDIKDSEENVFTAISPEAIQAFKDMSVTVSGKLNTSKKILKEKWEGFEGKMKNLGTEKQPVQEFNLPKRNPIENVEFKPVLLDENIIYKESSQKAIEIDNNCIEKDVCKSLYQYFRLSLVGKETDRSIDSCISVNMRTQKLANIGCDCGFPLPYTRTNSTPIFSGLIDEFIERQWSSQSRDQCYEICKKMPYLWRKILYLRRNEDLLNVLRVLLQMLDENLLHSFLPQFTMESWDRAIQLYATLHANMCLNCNKKFHHISVRDMLSWDDLGALIIKSVGGKNAVKLLEKRAKLVDVGELTMKFYHTALLVAMYEKYDVTITSQLTEALYSAYSFEDSRKEICSLLRNTSNGEIKNTTLPLIIAAKTHHWGLSPILETIDHPNDSLNEDNEATVRSKIKDIPFNEVIDHLSIVYKHNTDCSLCGLPLQNEILIQDGGLWVFKCGHIFHGACLDLNKIKLCPSCPRI